MPAPRELGFFQPIETDPHEATLLAWPAAYDLWRDSIAAAREGFVALARGIADVDAPSAGLGEQLWVLVPTAAEEAKARAALAGLPVRFFRIPYGDIWLRDIAPIFLRHADGRRAMAVFRFNGWGGKYVLEHDDQVATQVASALELPRFDAPFVLEGGSVDVDGEGTVLTTEQCLLNQNRNPGRDRAQIERDLAEYLGASKTLWIKEGLKNDHTDGHIDNIARFVAPGRVVCQAAAGPDDPNRATLDAIAATLAAATDATGKRLDVVRIPGVGLYRDAEGNVSPASHMNFIIGNGVVVVPVYGTPSQAAALAALAKVFPDRKVVGVPSQGVLGCGLAGGGSFHCITQQEPA